MNSSYKREEQKAVFNPLKDNLEPLTSQFIDSIIQNRQFNLLPNMIRRYDDLIKQLSKEESIKVISASALNESDRTRVEDALVERIGSRNFQVEYEVDEDIVGGLQVYFGNSFLDCSLATRLQRVQTEVESISL